MSVTALDSWVDDRSLYPLHEEDDVPEITRHGREVRNLLDVLEFRFPDRLVAGNICIYWVPGDFQLYYAPDAFVTESPPDDPEPRVYHVWQDPPIVFAAEVKSRSITEAQREHNFRICEWVLCIPELLEFDPEEGLLRLWRLGPQGYESVEPEANGRLRSQELALEFGLDEGGRLRAYTLDGEVLRTHAEAERDRERAERDREAAEERATAEAHRREAAEERATAEARQREVAEERAIEEARQREAAVRAHQAAEERAIEAARQREELEREVAALRAALRQQAAGSEEGGPPG